MVNPGKRQAALAIWPWREPKGTPPVRQRRAAMRHGLTRAAVAIVAAGVLTALGKPVLAATAAGMGLLTGLLAALSPDRGYAALQRALDRVGAGVGLALTWLVLAPTYLLILTPFGLLLRHGKRDPLRRAFAKDAGTYWTDRTASPDSGERRKRPF